MGQSQKSPWYLVKFVSKGEKIKILGVTGTLAPLIEWKKSQRS